jgi:Cu(I)/Ag(I) efflux system membrane protein CusA/SilA
MRTVQDIRNATVEAGRRRIRPCLMTAFTTFAALLPVMLATGRGSDVARAMALPVFFGMFIELVSLFVVPVLYCGYMEMTLNFRQPTLPLDSTESIANQSPEMSQCG